jgi:peptidylprolyl isomerase
VTTDRRPLLDAARAFVPAAGLAGMMLLLPAAAMAQAQPTRPQVRAPAASPAPSAAQAAAPAQPSAPPAAASDAGGGDVIARVGGINVTVNEVRAYVEQLSPRDQQALAHDPRLLSQTVRTMLANQLVLKEAAAKKWDQQPAVAAQLERVRDEVIVETYLRAVSAPTTGYPTDAEIENVYESNKSAFLAPRQFHLAQIVVAVSQGADKETEDKAKRKLEEVQKKLKSPNADFAGIATSDSDERQSATAGGDLGWLAENQIRTEIRTHVIGLAASAVSEPVRLEDGWHLVKLIETRPAATRPLAEVRDQLAQRMRDERAAANRRAYLGKLIEQSPPAINELALSKVLAEPGQKPAAK